MGAADKIEPAPAERRSLPALVDAYLHELTALRRLSAHTRAAYEHDLTQLDSLARADATDLASLTAASIRRYAAKLHAGGLAPTSIARMLSA
jgi:integrase/recombinase XerC